MSWIGNLEFQSYKTMAKNNNLLLIFIISAIVLVSRFLPHTPNFSPLLAVTLFTAVYADKKLFFLPFLVLFISDIFIGFYTLGVMFSVYFSLLITLFLGKLLGKHYNTINTFSASLLSGLLFFFVTNFAVWYFGDWYSRDLAGLISCYTLAIPFFKTTLVSNLLYTGLLFGAYETLFYFLSKKKSLAHATKA